MNRVRDPIYETLENVKKVIDSNSSLFFNSRGEFRISSSQLNDIAFVFERYGPTACKLFIEDKRKRANEQEKELYSRLIDIVSIIEKNNFIMANLSIGRYIIKNLGIIKNIGG